MAALLLRFFTQYFLHFGASCRGALLTHLQSSWRSFYISGCFRACFRICCRCLHYCFRLTVSKVSANFYTSFFRFPTNFLPLFRSFVHFHHWHIGAYADFSLFFGAQLTFCLTVRLLFIELKRERQKNGNKSKCAEQIMNTSKYECNSDE